MEKEQYVAVDLETTGLNPRSDQILEIGAVLVEDGETVKTFSAFVNTGIQVPPAITELTGITQEMAESGKPLREALEGFLDFCGERDILGHNIPFDYGFLKQNLANLRLPFEKRGIDTLKIARKHLADLPSRSLETLCGHYGILQEKRHRACVDAMSASRLYQKLKEEFGREHPGDFLPVPLAYRVKKEGPITKSQKVYLLDLAKYHRIDLNVSVDELTKSEASRMINRILLQYGRIYRR